MSPLIDDFLFYFFIPLNILIFAGLLYISLVHGHSENFGNDTETPVLIILPCRGIDHGMENNILSLKNQKHGDFRLLAVVDSEGDPAVSFLKEAGIEHIVSHSGNGSGKVNAIVSAIEEDHSSHKVTVIVDSDTVVSGNWLSALIAPLRDDRVGISTTFPFFDPVGGFWSKVKMVWGYVGLGMMQSTLTRFGWGGSLAFRSELLTGKDLDFFSSYVSDDIAITKICRKYGLKIAYVPEAAPLVKSPDDFNTFIEWANRQTALSIYATRKVLGYGVLFYGATIFEFLSAIILTVIFWPFYPVLILFLPAVINAIRSSKRSGKHWKSGFLLQFMIPFVYFYNLVKGGRMKSIVWRGREYPLDRTDDP